ncbi:MAG: short chain dehydrogenase [Rhizobiaceae bacterium]
MKILIVGATGTIGKAVTEELKNSHEIVTAGYRDGEFQVDLGSSNSIKTLFKSVGKVDAIISAAGNAPFAPFDKLDDEGYELAFSNKLMGQVNLVRFGREYLSDGGSVILTAGVLAHDPIPGSVAVSMANGALESFARAASLELDRGLRVNIVNPAFVKETMEMMGMDPTPGISARDTAKAYMAALKSSDTGSMFNAPDYV